MKFIIEIAPLIAFFIGYKTGGIINATIYILITSVICGVLLYIKEKKINKVNVISTLILVFSASLTIFSGNSLFIKIKPTIMYSLFAIILLISGYKDSPVIKHMLGSAIKLGSNSAWKILNTRFVYFFVIMACFNEIIWRNFSEESWVKFKVFGALPITIIFIMLQMPFLMKHQNIEDTNKNQ